MNPLVYPVFVHGLTKDMNNDTLNLLHGAVGMAGETGEVVDLIKKVWVYERQIDLDKLVLELGDVRFYYQMILNFFGLTDDDVVKANMQKLAARYPDGVFSSDAANKRLDVQ